MTLQALAVDIHFSNSVTFVFLLFCPIIPHMSVSSTVQRDRGPNRHVQVMRPTHRSNSPPPITTKTTSNSVSYAQQQLGVSLSEGLEKAYNECKAKVERIAAQCRVKNRKFRYYNRLFRFVSLSLPIIGLTPCPLHLLHNLLSLFIIEMSNSISKTTQTAVYTTSRKTIFSQLLTSDESQTYLKILSSSAALQNQLKLFKER